MPLEEAIAGAPEMLKQMCGQILRLTRCLPWLSLVIVLVATAASAESRRPVFTVATDLVPAGTGLPVGSPVVYVRDMLSSDMVVVSVASTGAGATGFAGDISADGRYVVFNSADDGLPLGDGTTGQIYLRDRDADGNGVFDETGSGGMTMQILTAFSTGDTGVPGNADSVFPVISDDGNFVAFSTQATNLFTDANGSTSDVALWSSTSAVIAIVDVDSTGVQRQASGLRSPRQDS